MWRDSSEVSIIFLHRSRRFFKLTRRTSRKALNLARMGSALPVLDLTGNLRPYRWFSKYFFRTISVWDLASQQAPIWKWKNVANDEIQCIDWSPDSKWLCSAFRDGTGNCWLIIADVLTFSAFLHDAQNGKLCTELHTLFLISQGTDAYRFRSVKFIPGLYFLSIILAYLFPRIKSKWIRNRISSWAAAHDETADPLSRCRLEGEA